MSFFNLFFTPKLNEWKVNCCAVLQRSSIVPLCPQARMQLALFAGKLASQTAGTEHMEAFITIITILWPVLRFLIARFWRDPYNQFFSSSYQNCIKWYSLLQRLLCSLFFSSSYHNCPKLYTILQRLFCTQFFSSLYQICPIWYQTYYKVFAVTCLPPFSI